MHAGRRWSGHNKRFLRYPSTIGYRLSILTKQGKAYFEERIAQYIMVSPLITIMLVALLYISTLASLYNGTV